jgi:hypothetical protein
MRNEQGDAWFCVFSGVGVFLKGFDHESQMSPWSMQPHVWRGVLDDVPAWQLFERVRLPVLMGHDLVVFSPR